MYAGGWCQSRAGALSEGAESPRVQRQNLAKASEFRLVDIKKSKLELMSGSSVSSADCFKRHEPAGPVFDTASSSMVYCRFLTLLMAMRSLVTEHCHITTSGGYYTAALLVCSAVQHSVSDA